MSRAHRSPPLAPIAMMRGRMTMKRSRKRKLTTTTKKGKTMINRNQMLDEDGEPLGSTVVPSSLEITFGVKRYPGGPPKVGDVIKIKKGKLLFKGTKWVLEIAEAPSIINGKWCITELELLWDRLQISCFKIPE